MRKQRGLKNPLFLPRLRLIKAAKNAFFNLPRPLFWPKAIREKSRLPIYQQFNNLRNISPPAPRPEKRDFF